MANRWGNNGNSDRLYFGGAPKSPQMVTAATKWKDAGSLEEKFMANLDSILKSRDITLPTKVCLVKATIFPVVMYGCERWTIKKADCQRIDAFELWCWRRLLRVPWTARRSNQSILKEISPKYSLERLMVKLKLQSFGHLMQRTNSLEKTLMLGKIEGGRRRDDRGWDGWMASLTQTWVWASSGSWWWTGRPGMLQSMGSQRVRHNWANELNWTDAYNNSITKQIINIQIYLYIYIFLMWIIKSNIKISWNICNPYIFLPWLMKYNTYVFIYIFRHI